MLARVIKFLDVISNELSYAEQNVNLWEDLEKVGDVLSNVVEERNYYKEKYESEHEYLRYMRGAYMESSERCAELSTENEELREELKILKAENEKLKDWESAYQSLLTDYYQAIDNSQEFFESNINLSIRLEELYRTHEKLETDYKSLLSDYYDIYTKDFYEPFDKQHNLKIFFAQKLLEGVLKFS